MNAKYRRNLSYPRPQSLRCPIAASQTILKGDLLAIGAEGAVKAGAACTALFGIAGRDVNTGVRATQVLTFSGISVDNETVTIGSTTFEFTVDGTITAGNVAVLISGTTADEAVEELAHAINNIDWFDFYAVYDTTGDTVTITAKESGTDYNDVATTETCTNAAWGAATTASGTLVAGKVDGDIIDVHPIMPGDVVTLVYTGGTPSVYDLFITRFDITAAQLLNLDDTTGGFCIPVGFNLDDGTIDVIFDMTVLWTA